MDGLISRIHQIIRWPTVREMDYFADQYEYIGRYIIYYKQLKIKSDVWQLCVINNVQYMYIIVFQIFSQRHRCY